jgi:uncharacterized protein YfaA (DUF2138 family)
MTYMSSFSDEFKKIAGEMQGFTRIGRKPISIEKMLSNESEITSLPEDFAPVIEKAASAMVKMAKHKAVALVGAGAVGALTLRQMNEDRRLGRMVRKQQQAQQ